VLGSAVLGAFYLASATAQTPGLPPPLPVSAPAKLYARSQIARSNATRSNYIRPHITVLLTKYRYPNPAEIVDVTPWTRDGTLTVTQALNDQPDSCALTLTPHLDPANVPQVGDVIAIGLATEGSGANQRIAAGLEFSGPVVTVQQQRRQGNGTPWVHCGCADWQWWFDAAIVNWIWPAQSATITIRDLLARYVNFSQVISDPTLMLTFTDDFVQEDLASCTAFTAINWRPSAVIRHLLTELQGGWYIDALRRLHVWSGSTEPQQSDPQTLTNYLGTLKAFTHTVDATQVRRRVVVEGMITQSAVDVPTLTSTSYAGGIPVADARAFVASGTARARFGGQWVNQSITHPLQPSGQNAFAAHVSQAYTLGDAALYIDAFPAAPTWDLAMTVPGWIKVNEQFIRYESATAAGGLGYALALSAAIPFGHPVAGISLGDVATWVHWLDTMNSDAHQAPAGTLMPVQGTAAGADVVVIAEVTDSDANQAWAPHLPPLEALVQDGRYSYAGAAGRAAADLAYFKAALLTAQWETTDFNARPGRSQQIQLTDVAPVSAVVTILNASVTFPLRHLAPQRMCTGSTVKPATLLDVLIANTV
jgi:hypothetical protein